MRGCKDSRGPFDLLNGTVKWRTGPKRENWDGKASPQIVGDSGVTTL